MRNRRTFRFKILLELGKEKRSGLRIERRERIALFFPLKRFTSIGRMRRGMVLKQYMDYRGVCYMVVLLLVCAMKKKKSLQAFNLKASYQSHRRNR